MPKLFAHFQEGREFYLVQEYIEGHDISRELTSGKKFSESDTIALLAGILEALAVAHQNNIIHQDIKPQNLMRSQNSLFARSLKLIYAIATIQTLKIIL
ncbi:protein kinase domain-containing protein [Dapis sp. BLCC M126]|uniref:protein kinase domain-containing protein n=1 Tax=Dapis sp. BLCC M126 TaxID=3400189 RepID=UPI003CFAC7C5